MSSPLPSFPPNKAQKRSKDQSPSSLVTHALPPLPPRYPTTRPNSVARDPSGNERSTLPNKNAPSCANPLDVVCDPLSLHFHSNQASSSVPEDNGLQSYYASVPPSYIGLPQNVNVIQPASVPGSPDPNSVNTCAELTQASLQPLATSLEFHGYANGFGFEAAAGISSRGEAGLVAGHVPESVIQPASVPRSPDPNSVNPCPELTQESLQPLATNLDFHGYANGFGFEAAAEIPSGGEAGLVAGHVPEYAFDPFSCYPSEHLAGIHSQCDVESPTGDTDAQFATQAVQMPAEDLGQIQHAPPELHDYLSLLAQGIEESPQPDPEYWDWQSCVQMAQEKVGSNPHLQPLSSLIASFSPASSNPIYVNGILYKFGCHLPGEILTAFGFPKDDRDAEYCVENTPGLSTDNFGVLEKTILRQVRVIRMAATQAAAELENIFIAHMAYRVITECEVYVRFEHLVNTFLEARQCIIERYRCYVRNLRAIENVSTRQRRGCLEHRQNNTMRHWLYEHFGNPYPEGNDKKRLIEETGLKGRQINNWFINARSRIWRPTVEGMSREFLQQAADMLYEDRYSKIKRKPKIELEGGRGELTHLTGEGTVRN